MAVVGAGPAGCAAAAAAARRGWSVTLVDPAIEGSSSPEGELGLESHGIDDGEAGHPPRVGEGAAPGTPQLVAEIFGPETGGFTPGRHVMCPGTVSAWGTAEPMTVEHVFNPLGPAWNLDRGRFDEDLRTAARRLGVGTSSATVTALETEGETWTLTARADGGATVELEVRVVVDATGRGARVGHLLRAGQGYLDHLVALWALWSVDPADQRAATHVEPVEGGWWYSTLLPAGRRMVVFLTDADLTPTTPLARRELALSARMLPLIGSLLELSDRPDVIHGPRLAVARSGWLRPTAGPAWFAAGDAACTVDPLSGRGIVSALLTGRAAGEGASAVLDDHRSSDPVEAYRSFVTKLVLDGYRRQVDAYGAERRWPGAAFWQRRHHLEDAANRGTLAALSGTG